MTKTSKKILISIVLFIAICLLHNTNVFAASDAQKAFDKFADYKYESTYNIAINNYTYIETWDVFDYIKPKITISDTNIMKIEESYSNYYMIGKTVGKTKVKISATYKGETVTKSFYVNVFETKEDAVFQDFVQQEYKDTKLYLGERISIQPYEVNFYLNPKMTVNNTDVAKVEKDKYSDTQYVTAKKVGKAKVAIKITRNGKSETKKFWIKVVQTKESLKLESTTNDVLSITTYELNKPQILLANSELWKVDSNTFKLTKKATGNVAEYVYTNVYHFGKYFEQAPGMLLNTLKNDKTLTIKSDVGTLKVKNVVDMSSYGYLTKSKNYCGIIAKDGKITAKKMLTNVDRLIGDYLLVKNNKLYTVGGIKICNASVRDAIGSCVGGLVLNKKGILYSYEYDYETDKYKTKQIATGVKSVLDYNTYKTKSGKIKYVDTEYGYDAIDAQYIDDNELIVTFKNKLKLNGTTILTNVENINYVSGSEAILIVRKDGSIWRLELNGKATLTKVRSGKDKYKKLSTPTKVATKKLSSKKVKVSWNKVEGATKYTIYRATSKNGTYKKVGKTTTNVYKDTSVKKGKTYYYKIVANGTKSLYTSYKSSAAKINL